MKKIIIIALCFIALFKANSQTIDTTIKYCVAAKIVPVLYSHDFPVVTDTLTHLGVFEYRANDSVWSISYTLIASNPTRNILFGWQAIKDTDIFPFYNGELSSLLEPLKRKFGLTFR